MREASYPLHSKEKHDAIMRLPILGTSQVVERMLRAERQRGAAALEVERERRVAAEAKLAELLGSAALALAQGGKTAALPVAGAEAEA